VTSLLPIEVIAILRPLQRIIRETSHLIHASPWGYLATMSGSHSVSTIGYSTQSPASQVPLPMTPQSAALGPAVQATVPSTPQSGTYNAMFSGNVFDRADAYLSMNGGSVASSRNGTMTSATMTNDGSVTPASTLMSPLNATSSRFNGNGKMGF
jgi:hypothetical protein